MRQKAGQGGPVAGCEAASSGLGERHWLVVRGAREGPVEGPFDALDIAYGVFAGRIAPGDVVVDAQSGARRLVAEDRALRQWMEPGPATARRLFRAARRRARARTRGRLRPGSHSGSARPALPTWVWSLLSHEQRRAFHVLDLDPACSSDEAARRYRELAMEHHPDRGGDARAMGVLNRAYSEVRQLLAPSPSGTNPTAAGS